MKRWILVLVALLLFAVPVSAERPLPDVTLDREADDAYLSFYSFPEGVSTLVELPSIPHVRARLTVAGDGWSFALVQRRWGWEMEEAFCPEEAEQALVLASIDYLNGQADALEIFPTAPVEYVETLNTLRLREG